jgi:flagellar motor switch protein FliM
MAEQALSQEELKALLDDENAPKRTHQVLDYDFAHPTRLTREQNKALTRAQQAAATAIAADLCAAVRSPLQATSSGISEIGFAGLRASLPNPTVLYVLSAPPLPERGLLVVEPKIAFALVDRLLGGPGKAPSPLRPLTALERGLLDQLVKKALERIAAAWKDIAAFTPAVESLAMDPAEVDAIPSGETLVCAGVSITGEGEFAGGEIKFCLPYIALEPSLARLGRPTRFAATKSAPTVDQRKQIDLVLGKARLEVRVELGTATLTIGEILAMAPGDVIVLDQGPKDLMPGAIGGKRRFLGRSGRLGKKLAVLVEKVLPRPKD